MSITLKLALSLALLIAILALVLGVFMNNLAVQLICFGALSLALLIRRGPKR